MSDLTDKLVKRFASLFRGNPRTHGEFDAKTGYQETKYAGATEQDYLDHLNGTKGLGMVPILDDNTCYFGALDLDAHGDEPDIDLIELERQVKKLELPLVVCRSKSGGAHLYLFGMEPLRAAFVRKVLIYWSSQLGYFGCEVFPKQSTLSEDTELKEMQNGNWLNLAQFDAENPECLRYCVEGGQKVGLPYFIELAEAAKITAQQLMDLSEIEHKEAPPCIQAMYRDGVQSGARNIALYNIAIYLKRAFPDSYSERAHDFNMRRFDEPLQQQEAQKVVRSATRREYKYKCSEEPLCSNCNSNICVNRQFGISSEDKSEMDLLIVPEFQKLIELQGARIDTWLLIVNGQELEVKHEDLLSYRRIRSLIVKKLKFVPPAMKDQRWEAILAGLLKDVEIQEVPEEATDRGILKSAMLNFLNQCDLSSDGTDTRDRIALMSGSPVVQLIREDESAQPELVALFRYESLISHIKDRRIELETKTGSLWRILQEIGCRRFRIRPKKNVSPVKCWYYPVAEIDNYAMDDDDDELSVEPEF